MRQSPFSAVMSETWLLQAKACRKSDNDDRYLDGKWLQQVRIAGRRKAAREAASNSHDERDAASTDDEPRACVGRQELTGLVTPAILDNNDAPPCIRSSLNGR